MYLASTFHQQTQELALPELLQKRLQRDSIAGFRRQTQDLGSADAQFIVDGAEGYDLGWYATQEIGPLLELL